MHKSSFSPEVKTYIIQRLVCITHVFLIKDYITFWHVNNFLGHHRVQLQVSTNKYNEISLETATLQVTRA